ncbi:MAG: segregation/condensation protein A [Nitrospirae bacterium]|nr:MAG: segregation/condensation protein A [Nitrospirota bacterium]
MEFSGMTGELIITESESDELPYHVRLDSFAGPLDLLLHLIRKHEINIYDIPIAMITQQYLDYLSFMKSLNLSLAGEFLVMAATLLHIKSRMLLPTDDASHEEQEEGEDPREELVRRLLEYDRFKEAAGRLAYRERMWRDVFEREPAPIDDDSPDIEETEEIILAEDLDLFDLLSALQDVLNRKAAQACLNVTVDTLTVQERIHWILECLEFNSTVTFQSLFDPVTTRAMVIVTFLALLELVRMKLVRVHQSEVFGPIQVSRTFSPGTWPQFDKRGVGD